MATEKTSQEVADALAKPMPYKWRLKTVTNKAKKPYPDGTRGQFLAYIDARDVFNRLDGVVGMANWQSEVKRINEDGSVIVTLKIRTVDTEWLIHEDVGYPNNPGAGVEDEPLKAATSDAIKRAAIHFGIGRFLYDLPPTWTEIDANGQPLRQLANAAPDHASVDPQSGEIYDDSGEYESGASQPAPQRQSQQKAAANSGYAGTDEETQPCAIDGCTGTCMGSWVAFSKRRYGVPLCSKHSAQAKRGEIENELAALNGGRN